MRSRLKQKKEKELINDPTRSKFIKQKRKENTEKQTKSGQGDLHWWATRFAFAVKPTNKSQYEYEKNMSNRTIIINLSGQWSEPVDIYCSQY